jgi:hypothetical protein
VLDNGDRALASGWRVRCSSQLHVHRSFLAHVTWNEAIATQLTVVSVRYESAVHVVRPRGRAPVRCSACRTSAIRGLHNFMFRSPRRVTSSGSVPPHRAAHLAHSWNSYMSPCPPSGVKLRAGSKPRRYPSGSGVAHGVPHPGRAAAKRAAAATREVAAAAQRCAPARPLDERDRLRSAGGPRSPAPAPRGSARIAALPSFAALVRPAALDRT